MDLEKDKKIELEYTGERMVPGKAGDESEMEHLSRYRFARGFVAGRKTIDIGCGDGYGSAMLRETASEVTGVDISEEAVGWAASRYKLPSLEFRVMDAEEISFEPGTFDTAVCFEVYEHIPHPGKLLAGIRKILRPGGALIISTPNGTLIKSGIPNPYHVKEYTLDEFNSALGVYFPKGQYSYQRFGQFNLRRRSGATAGIFKGWVKLKRKLGIGKIMPDRVSQKLKDSSSVPYTYEDFDFRRDELNNAEYFLFVITGLDTAVL